MPEQLELARSSDHEIWNYDVELGERVRLGSTSTVRRGSIGVTTEVAGKTSCSYPWGLLLNIFSKFLLKKNGFSKAPDRPGGPRGLKTIWGTRYEGPQRLRVKQVFLILGGEY